MIKIIDSYMRLYFITMFGLLVMCLTLFLLFIFINGEIFGINAKHVIGSLNLIFSLFVIFFNLKNRQILKTILKEESK